jgi:hypothetical protein
MIFRIHILGQIEFGTCEAYWWLELGHRDFVRQGRSKDLPSQGSFKVARFGTERGLSFHISSWLYSWGADQWWFCSAVLRCVMIWSGDLAVEIPSSVLRSIFFTLQVNHITHHRQDLCSQTSKRPPESQFISPTELRSEQDSQANHVELWSRVITFVLGEVPLHFLSFASGKLRRQLRRTRTCAKEHGKARNWRA